ncbi:MAG: hypothetical protein EA397_04545 [Deltaproteobacteria bacterium]|nr:MAG: hypothetical protein EA397_04545 [Deltaproteobacteria bacterium]
MDFSELKPTERIFEGPAAKVIELQHRGHVWSALVHRAPYRDPELVDEVLDRGRGFLTNPMISGLVEIDDWSPGDHQLLYPTGRVWSLADLLAHHRAALGPRAGLELAYRAALILQEASAAGEESGVPLHGDPTPWRWLIDAEGDLQLIGWGVPALELYALDRDPDLKLSATCYQYLAPERLEGGDEDLSTDLFTLALIAAEALLGEPVYSGTAHAVRIQAERAEGGRRLYALRDRIPPEVATFLRRALAPYRDGRHPDVEDFIREAHDLLYSPLCEGPSLTELVQPLVRSTPALPQPPLEPDHHADRWRPVARRGQGSGQRPIDDVEAPEASSTLPLAARSASRPKSAVEELRRGLRESQVVRDASLRDRLAHTQGPRAAMRDRTTLFPTLPIEGRALRYLIEMPEGGTVWARLGPDETLAMSAARVADQSRHTPVGPDGAIEGWFRLTQGGEAWFGCTLTRVISAPDPVQLEFIPNRLFRARISVHEDEPPVELDVGTAIHAAFLVSHLRHRYELRARDWDLYADDERPLDPWQVLDDFEPKDGFLLKLRRQRRGGRRRRVR